MHDARGCRKSVLVINYPVDVNRFPLKKLNNREAKLYKTKTDFLDLFLYEWSVIDWKRPRSQVLLDIQIVWINGLSQAGVNNLGCRDFLEILSGAITGACQVIPNELLGSDMVSTHIHFMVFWTPNGNKLDKMSFNQAVVTEDFIVQRNAPGYPLQVDIHLKRLPRASVSWKRHLFLTLEQFCTKPAPIRDRLSYQVLYHIRYLKQNCALKKNTKLNGRISTMNTTLWFVVVVSYNYIQSTLS